jgi:hypothetical protein
MGDAGSWDEKDAIRTAAEGIPGVRKVEDHISTNQMRFGI